MSLPLCYQTTASERAVLYLDGRSVTANQDARSRVYEAWRHYAQAPPRLPATPMRWLARTNRAAVLPAFPPLINEEPKNV